MSTRILLTLLLFAIATGGRCQPDTVLLAHDEAALYSQDQDDPNSAVNDYEPLNARLGGDSVRLCGGYACIGWVEDRWANGNLKHRGYYNNGQLLIYKNYHDDGTLEREFKVIDDLKCELRTYHTSGTLRSEATYFKGRSIKYADLYPNGQLRYREEKHRTEPYYLVMDMYSASGQPLSTLQLVDKKKIVFEQKEYHPNGQIRSSGRAQYDPGLMDSRRIGTWTYYDPQGVPDFEEHYIEGKVHERKEL